MKPLPFKTKESSGNRLSWARHVNDGALFYRIEKVEDGERYVLRELVALHVLRRFSNPRNIVAEMVWGMRVKLRREIRSRQVAESFLRHSDAAVKKLWDAVIRRQDDGPVLGFMPEEIHYELNRRGLGRYCAV